MQIETRGRTCDKLNIETRADGNEIIAGYAAVFFDGSPETEFELLPGVFERLHPGAFEGRRHQRVMGLYNHQEDHVLGSEQNGTLRLSVDQRGLRYEIDPNLDDPMVQGVLARIKRGDIHGSSFGFLTRDNGADWSTESDRRIRNLRSLDLFDVGPVTFEAYSGTDVTIARRSLTAYEHLTTEHAARTRDLILTRCRLAYQYPDQRCEST